ncbi:MAG: 5-(carboxyamino)imidazole ribonucleotide mutase [Firmicutes bacterium HGW-Firmicutes-11]|nr:MAG: 5-(carboxyamino)imidazole ribonucleotide mutase [Firmicutes bacterium HGW-Firmicutes-11]
MGSDSDYPVVKKAEELLAQFNIPCITRVLSAHRTPAATIAFAAEAKDNGIKVIIAAAGKAAHLAGVLAAHTTLPVIGIPMRSSTLDGLDALLSTVQMPKGVPVATVAIDGSENAAILAAQILALSDPNIAETLIQYKHKMELDVLEKDRTIGKE